MCPPPPGVAAPTPKPCSQPPQCFTYSGNFLTSHGLAQNLRNQSETALLKEHLAGCHRSNESQRVHKLSAPLCLALLCGCFLVSWKPVQRQIQAAVQVRSASTHAPPELYEACEQAPSISETLQKHSLNSSNPGVKKQTVQDKKPPGRPLSMVQKNPFYLLGLIRLLKSGQP